MERWKIKRQRFANVSIGRNENNKRVGKKENNESVDKHIDDDHCTLYRSTNEWNVSDISIYIRKIESYDGR